MVLDEILSNFNYIFFSKSLIIFHFFILLLLFYRSIAHPCFGSLSPDEEPMTSEMWWMEVVRQTFRTTETLDNCLDFKEIEKVLPVAFKILHQNVFNTKEGWVIKEDAAYTLQKLSEWRDQGGGPKIGVISNYDIRLNNILEGNHR
jgi:hypothetical protein